MTQDPTTFHASRRDQDQESGHYRARSKMSVGQLKTRVGLKEVRGGVWPLAIKECPQVKLKRTRDRSVGLVMPLAKGDRIWISGAMSLLVDTFSLAS